MAERGIRIAETGVRFSLGPPRGENFSARRIAQAGVLIASLDLAELDVAMMKREILPGSTTLNATPN